MLPLLSIAIPIGFLLVFPSVDEIPAGVIFVTLYDPLLVV